MDRWLVEQVQASREISQNEGRITVLAKYFSRVVAASAEIIERLFGWRPDHIRQSVERLLDENVISDAVTMADAKGKWFVHRALF